MAYWQYRDSLQPEVERLYQRTKTLRKESTFNSRCGTCYVEQYCNNCQETSGNASHQHDSKKMKDFVVQSKLWEIGVRLFKYDGNKFAAMKLVNYDVGHAMQQELQIRTQMFTKITTWRYRSFAFTFLGRNVRASTKG